MKNIFLCMTSFMMLFTIASCEKAAPVPVPEQPVNKENGHEFVDLGLSVKWATMNVGATKPEEFGNYYAFGETSPKTSYTKENYTYSAHEGVLPLEDDAAHVNWGGAWRTPTFEELEELLNQCTWTWCWDYGGVEGLFGYIVTSKVNGNSIFLPSAGDYGKELYLESDLVEGRGEYMTSTCVQGKPDNFVFCLYFYFDSSYIFYDDYRAIYDWYPGDLHRGRTIRPVISK
jgi:predicted small lipoprotein YifL